MSAVCASPERGATLRKQQMATAASVPESRGAARVSEPRGATRLSWLDFFRGLAVLVMIETHVVNTFMDSSLREHSWFALLNYVNGLVAPSFLFIAGFIQGGEWRKSATKPINYARRAWRLAGTCMLGYGMHFPLGEVLHGLWSDAYRVGSGVDVLQCLSAGLGMLLAVQWAARKFGGAKAAVYWWGAVVALAGATILIAPLAQTWTGGPIFIRGWVNVSTGSLFPVFPWLGFVFLGALVGALPERAAVRWATVVGLAAISWTCRDVVFSAVSPSFFLERAAWVVGLATVCTWGRAFPAAVLYAGRHSLKFYVAHLTLITGLEGAGVPVNVLGIPAVFMLLAVVLSGTTLAALACERLPGFLRSLRARYEPSVSGPESSPEMAG